MTWNVPNDESERSLVNRRAELLAKSERLNARIEVKLAVMNGERRSMLTLVPDASATRDGAALTPMTQAERMDAKLAETRERVDGWARTQRPTLRLIEGGAS